MIEPSVDSGPTISLIREGAAQPKPPHKEAEGHPTSPTYSAREASGGERILRTQASRFIFVAELVGVVLVFLIIRALA